MKRMYRKTGHARDRQTQKNADGLFTRDIQKNDRRQTKSLQF